MPKTAYSQRFKRELDPEQLLSLLGYDLKSDPDLKNLSGELRDEIHRDLLCPECGVRGGVIVSRSKSTKSNKALRQPHFRFERKQYLAEQYLRLGITTDVVSAFAALLLYITNWDVDAAISKLVAIVQAPTPTDMNAGNVIGLNPFHDFAVWANIMKAREVAQYSFNGFDYEAQIETIEQRLKKQYDEWKTAES
ncbi:MAG: hypothetical protein ACLFWI_29065 [Coleofasciculus sp.]|uniref:hypothetical protein n=1 Tax=Coleofasciculus sp. TaxID=3100458 RepID=UPI003A170920